MYLRARYYAPEVGRFTSRDPFPGWQTVPYSTHPYQYGYSNPVRYTDRSGRCTEFLGFECPPPTPEEVQECLRLGQPEYVCLREGVQEGPLLPPDYEPPLPFQNYKEPTPYDNHNYLFTNQRYDGYMIGTNLGTSMLPFGGVIGIWPSYSPECDMYEHNSWEEGLEMVWDFKNQQRASFLVVGSGETIGAWLGVGYSGYWGLTYGFKQNVRDYEGASISYGVSIGTSTKAFTPSTTPLSIQGGASYPTDANGNWVDGVSVHYFGASLGGDIEMFRFDLPGQASVTKSYTQFIGGSFHDYGSDSDVDKSRTSRIRRAIGMSAEMRAFGQQSSLLAEPHLWFWALMYTPNP